MDSLSGVDLIVFLLVVGGRFLLPLLIPFYPLPAIIVCLLLDGVDQTIFQTFTKLPLEGYQSYDKALDIYYLTVAYISTFRNWINSAAFQTSRFLFYYRLLGVALFEVLQWRPLLLIFPNTFEYFFIWIEAARLYWDEHRLTKKMVIAGAAAIWIFIKLPQEYWIHIAKLDVTDVLKELLGGTPETSWGEIIANNWAVILVAIIAIIATMVVLFRFIAKRLPPKDHPLTLTGKGQASQPTREQLQAAYQVYIERIFDRDLLEKAVLLSLLTVIFSKMLPTSNASLTKIAVDVTLFVIANTVASHFLARRGTRIASGIVHFLVVLAGNIALVLVGRLIFGGTINWFNATFFVLILSLIVTLFDRFQPIHLARFPRGPLFKSAA